MADNEKEIIKKIEAEALEAKPIIPEVLNSKRSAFINSKARLGGGGGNCLFDIVVAVDVSGSVQYPQNSPLSQAQNNFISSLITHWTPHMIAGELQMGICRWSTGPYPGSSLLYQTSSNKWLSNDPVELDVVAQAVFGTGSTQLLSGLITAETHLDKAVTDTANCSLGNRAGQSGFKRVVIFLTDAACQGPPAFVGCVTQSTETQAQWMWMNDIDIYAVRTHFGTSPPTAAQELAWRTLLQPISGTNGTLPGGDYSYTAAGTVASLSSVATAVAGSVCDPTIIPNPCYNIGDIGPEGGIIFSVPGVGPNTSTNIYYEVAQNDIDTATTPSSCFNISCGDEVVTYDVTNGKATHQMLDDNEFTFYWNDTPNPPYPNVGSNPPPQVGDTLAAITPNLFADSLGNPISTTTILSITPSTHPSGHGAFTVKIVDQLTAALDQSGNNTLPFKFSLTTTVVSPCTSPTPISTTIQPNAISQGSNVININYGPSFSLVIGTVSVPWNQSFNFINYAGWEVSGLDDNGNQLFPPNTTITSTTYPTVNNVGPYFTAQMSLSSPSLGNLTPSAVSSITLTGTTGLTPFGLQGSEWGAYDIPHSGTPPTIQTSLDFGLGLDNTDIIHAFPGNPGTPTGGTHPWLNTHDIAATVCKNHGTTNDWFLPSVQEFKEMFTNVGPGSSAANQITFNPLTQKSEHLYWTSSQHIDNGTGLQDPDKYAYAYDTITNNPKLAYRCHPLSVRPIRRFECEVEPLDPCKDPMVPNTCSCVEYNYRDGFHTGIAGYSGMILTWSSNTSSLTNPLPNLRDKNGNPVSSANTLPASDSSIGGEYIGVMLPTKDVMGNVYSASDIQNNMDSGMTFTLYDVDYTFLGKWRYDTIESISTLPGTPSGSHPYQCQVILMVLKNVTHLEGNIPQLLYDDPNWGESLTHVFFKVEHEMINNSISGCNSFLWGNAQFPNPQGTPGTTPISIRTNEFAHACDSTWAPPTWVNSCITNLLVYQPSTAVQHANLSDCAPTCGAASVNHCFSICGVFAGGSWNTPSNAWFGGEPYGPMAMENNPIGVTSPPFGSNPPGIQDYTAFYDWLTSQFQNPLTIGDTFIFQTSGYNMQISYIDSNGNTITGVPCTIICFKYEGMQNYNIPINVINNNFPLPIVAAGYCCQTSGSSSSLIIPVENDSNSIKLEFEQRLLSKRQKFIELRKPKKTGPFGILGYYPLYDNIDDAIENSPNSSYHIHEFNEQEFYMPNGLEMGVTQFHGDWNNGEEIQIEKTFNYPITTEDNIENDILLSDPIPEIIETPDIPTVISPPIITEPEEEPEEEPETTYTPPPSPPPSPGGGGSGGY
mgnify:CR=1 FL=1|tara:strand:- start:1819 stop:5808 length:3990 start_codon:yes stop_codon:yes gene_type:complete